MVPRGGGGLPSWGSAEELIPSRSDQKFLAGKESYTRLLRERFSSLHSGHADSRSVSVSSGCYDGTPDQGLRDNRNLFLAVVELEV